MKKDIIVTHRDDLNTDCEIIWTQCQIQNKRSKSLFFASFYRPNKTDINSLQELDSSYFRLGDRLNTSNVIVAGDFNAPDLKWNYPEPTNCSLNSERLLEIIDEHGLTQLVKEPTRDDNILDLVLTNSVNIINNVKVIPGISDHDMVLFEVNLACRGKKPVRRKIGLRYSAKRNETNLIDKEITVHRVDDTTKIYSFPWKPVLARCLVSQNTNNGRLVIDETSFADNFFRRSASENYLAR